MSALVIEHVTKHYGARLALDDLSLTIEPGDFFGFLGPNGAGKSTTIHLISGIARMEQGTIRIFGEDVVTAYRRARALIGLSPQEFNVDVFETPERILEYVAGYYGMPARVRTRRVTELVHRFDLTAHAQKEFRTLSGGLKRRVMLARALVHNPRLLILDEPTAGVDVELRRELWQYLRELNKTGTTILLTSHYLEEVELLCSRIAVINHGALVAIGDKRDFTDGGTTLEERYLALTTNQATV